MAIDNTIKPAGLKPSVNPVNPGQEILTPKEPKKDSSNIAAVSQDEFLTLLVNQLQNQDPLNPMESEEFAVQLATFSQLEQLVQINSKLETGLGSEDSPVGAMAAYLGHEVLLEGDEVQVASGRGSNLLLEVPGGTQSVRVDFIDSSGRPVYNHVVDEVPAGQQVVNLEGLPLGDGSYGVRVVSVDASGKFKELQPKVTGTVEGFVLEPEPKLLVMGQEVALDQISEVYKGKSSTK